MKLTDLIDKVRVYNSSAEVDVVRRAYDFSARVHKGQKRQSGEPYLTHPLAVAGIVADLRLDVPSIAAALLHDTVEDTLTTLEEVESLFGAEIAALVDGLTKIDKLDLVSKQARQGENFRKLLLAVIEKFAGFLCRFEGIVGGEHHPVAAQRDLQALHSAVEGFLQRCAGCGRGRDVVEQAVLGEPFLGFSE